MIRHLLCQTLIGGSLLAGLGARASSAESQIPFAWIHHEIPLVDSRPGKSPPKKDCALDLVELPLADGIEPVGAVLLIPGLFHNTEVFDLAPEEGISYARYLMLKKNLRVYALNPRGTARSCYPKKTNLDDIAIDDIPVALEFVAKKEGGPVWVFGQSQGGITLQAALAGLSRCGSDNCFRAEVATARQQNVRGIVLFGANVSMTDRSGERRLHSTSLVEFLLGKPFSPIVDRIHASWLTQGLSPTKARGPVPILSGKHSVAYWKFWEFAYHIPNVSFAARTAYYNRTLDHSTMNILLQYSRGIRKDGILAKGSDERYADHLGNIRVPVLQVAFELDPLAEPVASHKDNFERLGSEAKLFAFARGQGHEDFLMNSSFAERQSECIDWLLEEGRTCRSVNLEETL